MAQPDIMDGTEILIRSMSEPTRRGTSRALWQYHSRSDLHSKVACWAILFDLLSTCQPFRDQVGSGEVVFGVNHEMKDFRANRKKDLDLVISTSGTGKPKSRTFRSLAEEWGIVLTSTQRARLLEFPAIHESPVGMVRIALEAKACMTEHVKALSRFHDELNSSHLTVHGASDSAIAVGFAMINFASEFATPSKNLRGLDHKPLQMTKHRQPGVAQRVVEKFREIRRRLREGEEGFDAVGIVGVKCRNDGSTVELETNRPAPQSNEIDHYDSMIRRISELYSGRFGGR